MKIKQVSIGCSLASSDIVESVNGTILTVKCSSMLHGIMCTLQVTQSRN